MATPLRQVINTMQSKRQSCCLIGENGKPAGIVTERDLVQVMVELLKNPTLGEQPVSRYMTTPLHSIQIDQSLFDALVISRAERIRHLPVIDANDRLLGVVTQTDLVHAHFHVIEIQHTLIERAIQDRTDELLTANRELQSLSMEDALLCIGNRRAMEVELEHTHSLAMRYERQYSIALFDIDHFKSYNDCYGHLAGDRALQQVTGIIQKMIRKSDRLYRYGGEEFLLLLPDTTCDSAHAQVTRLVEALHTSMLPHRGSRYNVVTMSAGVADYRAGDVSRDSWEAVVHAADQALYQAKEAGRNRVA
jgi:diguanylate cyclase (GGDEF)-like protein